MTVAVRRRTCQRPDSRSKRVNNSYSRTYTSKWLNETLKAAAAAAVELMSFHGAVSAILTPI